MISGRFGDNGELYFEIVLITVDGEELLIEGLLDTGFTMGFLAVNEQDLYALGWPLPKMSGESLGRGTKSAG